MSRGEAGRLLLSLFSACFSSHTELQRFLKFPKDNMCKQRHHSETVFNNSGTDSWRAFPLTHDTLDTLGYFGNKLKDFLINYLGKKASKSVLFPH